MTNRRSKQLKITTLFLDVGGVLLTNGWDHHARRRAAQHFGLDWDEMEERHVLNFVIYETDKLTLQEYLGWVVFYKKRSFTRPEFWRFMCSQSKPCSEMIQLMRKLKGKYGLKVIVLSNEARELNHFRIHKFKLDEFVDAFVSSCLVRLHKPDPAGIGHFLDASPTNPLHRKHPDVCSDRRRSWNAWDCSHRLRIHPRETGCAGIAAWPITPFRNLRMRPHRR